MLIRRAFIGAALVLVATAADAQTWPSRPIKLIVPNGPGLASDILARLYADRMSQALGQQMFVENVPGASGITGAAAAARAAVRAPRRSKLSQPDGPVRMTAPPVPRRKGGERRDCNV